MVTWFTSDSAVSFSIQSATSRDFVPFALRAATATWLSVQIVICSFTYLFLRQLVIQPSIAATSAWKAVASCPCGMCHCSLLWYKFLLITSSICKPENLDNPFTYLGSLWFFKLARPSSGYDDEPSSAIVPASFIPLDITSTCQVFRHKTYSSKCMLMGRIAPLLKKGDLNEYVVCCWYQILEEVCRV